MGSGKSEQRFGEFQPFILHHIGIFVFDILQKSKQQINFLFIERWKQVLCVLLAQNNVRCSQPVFWLLFHDPMEKGLEENISWEVFELRSDHPISTLQNSMRKLRCNTLYTNWYIPFPHYAFLDFLFQSFSWGTWYRFGSPYRPLQFLLNIAKKEHDYCLDRALCRNQCEPSLSTYCYIHHWLPLLSYNMKILFDNTDWVIHDLLVIPFIYDLNNSYYIDYINCFFVILASNQLVHFLTLNQLIILPTFLIDAEDIRTR